MFGRGNDSQLYHKWQVSPGGAWSNDWYPRGGSVGSHPTVAVNKDGRLEVFAFQRGTDSSSIPIGLYHIWQTSPSDGWSSWEHMPTIDSVGAAVASNSDGRLEVLAVKYLEQHLYHIWQV